MPRLPRAIIAGIPYHIINRSNGCIPIFQSKKDFLSFEKIIEEASEIHSVPILAYTVMPNHWHFVLYPKDEGSTSQFMRWLTHTHSQRYRAFTQTRGQGHLYQGRFKSFPIQRDDHLLTVLRYVERNALRAKLVSRAEEWRPSSLWRRVYGNEVQKKLLNKWPINEPSDYLEWINTSLRDESVAVLSVRESINRGRPFGSRNWSIKMADQLGLQQTFRDVGRPKKGT